MKYTILVMEAPYGAQNASTAFLFCQSLVKTKNILHSVFFYCNGIFNANIFNEPANDEFDLTQAWQSLYKKYNVNLYVCISAALRRGVVKNKKISDVKTQTGNLAHFFQLSGLLELAYSIKICDRIIQF